mgnify:FL=1
MKSNFRDVAKIIGIGILDHGYVGSQFRDLGTIETRQFTWGKYGRMQTTYCVYADIDWAAWLDTKEQTPISFYGRGKLFEVCHNNALGFKPRVRVYGKFLSGEPIITREWLFSEISKAACTLEARVGLDIIVESA